jgi:hypothetical protein
MAKATAGSQSVAASVWTDSSGAPGTYLFNLDAQTVSGTAAAWYRYNMGARAINKAGTYHVIFYLPSGFAACKMFTNITGIANNDRSITNVRTTGVWQAQNGITGWAYAIGEYNAEGEAIVGGDQPVVDVAAGGLSTRTSVTAGFSGMEITLEPTGTAYVHRNTGFVTGSTSGALLHYGNGAGGLLVYNDQSLESFTIDKWAAIGSTFRADAVARQATYTEDGIEYPANASIEANNGSDDWLSLIPGISQDVELSDQALVTASGARLDAVLTYRARKV